MTLDETKLKEKIGFQPHENQQYILDNLKRFNVICAGTRFGKSILAAYIALKEIIIPNKRIWVVAPTYDLTKKIYAYLSLWIIRAFPKLLKDGAIKMSDRVGDMRIKFQWINSWIEFKSAENPTSLLGEELDLVVMDECSRIGKEIWESYIYSRLTSRNGKVVFISTSRGQNWFYFEWIKNKDASDGNSFHFTSKDNPYWGRPQSTPEEQWEFAKKRLPHQVFEQEHNASFLPDAAAVFRGIDEIIKDNCLSDVKSEHIYVMGVDIAKHEDFTVLTVIDTYNNNVVHFDRFNQIDYPFQKARIEATAKRFNARVIIDSTSVGEPIFEDLRRSGVFIDDFRFTNKSKKELVEKLSIFIEQKLIYIPNEEKLLNELRAFGYQLTDSGNIIYKAPEGLHDDCVISLALAVWGLVGKARPETVFERKLREERKPPAQHYI